MKEMFTNYCTVEDNSVCARHLRYERKFFITHLTKFEIHSAIRLHAAAFSEIYYERAVNNIYFDSFDMKNYFDNVAGLEKRTKIRIRWYGDLLGHVEKPVLELKVKKGLLCNKVSFPLSGFTLDGNFSKGSLYSIFRTPHIPEALKLDLMCSDISLLNTYRRKYYLSADKKYRLTLDSNLEFYEAHPFKNSFFNRSVDHTSNILEVKYGENNDGEVNRITGSFPFRMTKSSKYVMGIERLNLMKTYSHP